MTTVDKAQAEISALFSEWLDNISTTDESFFERVLDDDWIYTDIVGTVRGKREYIEYLGLVSGVVSGQLVELNASLHGEIALVTGMYTIEGSLDDGTDVSSTTRFTAVWQRENESWRALAHQGTSIPDS